MLYVLQWKLAMGRLSQFKLLLWKNYLLQRRKVLVTCLEIGLPTFFALILIFVRMRVKRVEVTNATSWADFAVNESLGSYNWISKGPWQIYYTPDSTTTKLVMESTMKHLNSSCDCISGKWLISIRCLVMMEKNSLQLANKLLLPTLTYQRQSSHQSLGSVLKTTQQQQQQPFYGSVEFVRETPGEPVPEETFTHYSHRSHQSSLSAFSI